MGEETRESPYGYNFYHQYDKCQYAFYLKNIFGLIPNEDRIELTRGKVGHSLIHKALTESPEAAMKEAEYQDSICNLPLFSFQQILDVWLNRRFDQAKKETIEAETQHEIMFGPDDDMLKFTFRLDRLIKRGERYGFVDTKFTGKTLNNAVEGFQRTNQFVAYKWAAEKKFPYYGDLFAEIEIVSMTKTNGLSIEPVILEFDHFEVMEWEANLYSLVSEVSQKVKALETYPYQFLFRRNRDWTCAFCPYDELCTQNIRHCMIPTDKFHIEPRTKEIEDIIKLNGGDKWKLNLMVPEYPLF